ncbi:AAA family ATPase [Aliarcobacter butzleri]|uniref:AAA family ATPase n=1 Tax=Aliarcobacter butzleri TaxID=28197 RepID=UPI002B24E605|nr:AAA family ATPase [Aliarcobacter butzleri]
MELVYLWVEGYKNIKNQGFNFSPRFECEFDGENLTINENKDYISIFPDNINVTAIVGENGSGKSSILESIIYISENEFQGFVIYYKNGLHYLGNINPNDYLKQPTKIIEPSEQNDKNIFVWINNINSYNIRAKGDLQVLLQKSSLFDKVCGENKNYMFKKHYELSKEIDLDKILEKQYYFDSFLVRMKNIRIEHKKYWREYNAIENKALLDGIDKIPFRINKKDDFYFILFYNFYIALIRFYLVNWNKLNENSDFYNILKNFIISMNSFVSGSTLSNEDFLKQIKNLIDDVNRLEYKNELLKNLLNMTTILFESLKRIEETKKIKLNYNVTISNSINFEFSKIYKFLENPKIEIYLFDIENFCGFNEDFEMFDFFSIDIINSKTNHKYTDLSNGERELLNISLDILFAMKNSANYGKNQVYILDEADAFLHPNWSKSLISKIIQIYTNYKKYINNSTKLHLLFSSHSPFLLSNLPKENVIFLEKYKENDDEVKKDNQKEGNCKNVSKDIELKTFGANIHTLLSDGFFMSDGLMGEFAKSKIEEIKKFYELIQKLQNKGKIKKELWKKSYEKRKTRFGNIQKIIGEPFLQTIIKNYLDELEILFNGKKEFLDKEIKRLEELRKELK